MPTIRSRRLGPTPEPVEAPPQQAEQLKMEGAAGDGPSPFAAGSVANEYKGGDVGTTVGGSIGVVNAVVDWDFTIKRTQEIIDAARSVKKDVFTLTHGGPVNTPKDVEFVLSKTTADGFVGASSLERMGVEDSLTNLTREFKAVRR